MKIGSVTRGFCKTRCNCWELWVCIWCKKVYTRLIVVYTGQYLVYTWFAHLEKSCTRCYDFYQYIGLASSCLWFLMLWKTACLKIFEVAPQRSYLVCTKFDRYLHQCKNKVYTQFTQHLFFKVCTEFAHSLHAFPIMCKLRVNSDWKHPSTPKLEMTIFWQPMIRLRWAKEQI